MARSEEFWKMLVYNWYLERVPRNEMEGAAERARALVALLFQERPPWLLFEGEIEEALARIEPELRAYAVTVFPTLRTGEASPY